MGKVKKEYHLRSSTGIVHKAGKWDNCIYTECGISSWNSHTASPSLWTRTDDPVTCRTCLKEMGVIERRIIFIDHRKEKEHNESSKNPQGVE